MSCPNPQGLGVFLTCNCMLSAPAHYKDVSGCPVKGFCLVPIGYIALKQYPIRPELSVPMVYLPLCLSVQQFGSTKGLLLLPEDVH